MKYTIIIAISFVFLFTPFAFAQESQISVQTDDYSYDEGDIVVISGNVTTVISNTPVTLQLFTEGSLVDIVQVTVAQDGSYSHTIIAEGPLWKKVGEYLVRVSYGEGNIAETEFDFSPKIESIETTTIFEVNAGSHGTFDVEYTIKGGTIKDIIVDEDIFAIIVQIESTDEGTVSLDLPRAFIGAEKQDGKDDSFIILIDGIEVAYQESIVHSDSRIITINFEEGDSDITIIGTYVVSAKKPASGQGGGQFRIIPESANVGSTIRITGYSFAASQEFDFYIDSVKLGSFVTDNGGYFITTMKIPDNQQASRVDFIVTDAQGNEKTVSLRIGELETRIPESENIKLTVLGIPNQVGRGDFLKIYGTGQPGNAITVEISNESGEIINTRTAEIDSKGEWRLNESIVISSDAQFGTYSLTVTDGRQTILKQWTVESDKVIVITPSELKFDLGQTMKFTGTALPNKPVEVILKDPLGNEVNSDIIQVSGSGFVEFEFPTNQNSIKGTYIVIVTQENEKEIVFVGVGQLPSISIHFELDKLSYEEGETAIISLIGKGSDTVSLLIIDPSDKPKGDAISITLQPDGRGTYSLDLDGYSIGVYTAVITRGNAQSTEVFTVGLKPIPEQTELPTPLTTIEPEPEPLREKVPSWIKNNAEWWSQGEIDDDTFVSGIQFLMKERIVNIPDLPEQASEKARPSFVDETKDPQHYIDRYKNEETYKKWFDENYPDYTIEEAVGITAPIPGWIKNTADWWSQGLITEEEFIKGIEFLVEKKILRVN